MKTGKCILLILIILLDSLLMAGCWNYIDIEKLSIVTGFAIDKSKEEGKYLLNVEVVDFEMMGKDSKATSKLIESEGYTIFDAVRNMINITGKKLYWAHAGVMVISQDIAKEGISPVLDFIFRDTELREQIFPVISKGKTATELIEQKPMIGQLRAPEIRDMLENQKSLGKAPKVYAYELLGSIQEEGISPVLPSIALTQVKEKATAKLNGTALLKKDKLVGFLNEEETKFYLYVVDKVEKGLLVESEDAPDKKYNITLEIFDSKTKVKPVYSNGKLVMNIDIKTDAAIGEIESHKDYISKEGREKLKTDAQRALKSSVERVIRKVQTEYKTDVFGFGKIVRAELPSVWKTYKGNWTDIFQNLAVNVNVDIDLRNSALLLKPIEKED